MVKVTEMMVRLLSDIVKKAFKSSGDRTGPCWRLAAIKK
jgi:hypothetical protein